MHRGDTTQIPSHHIHIILAHSYSLYFAGFLLGIILDFFFPLNIFHQALVAPLGVALLVAGPALIFWAQRTTRDYKKDGTITKEVFSKGPYCYSRSPTHAGIMFLMLGFGLAANAFFIVVFTLISAVVTRFTFLRKEEAILEKKYGAPYLAYKKEVKL